MKRLLTLTIALTVAMALAPSVQSQSKVTRPIKAKTQQSTGKKTTKGSGKSAGTSKSTSSASQPVNQSKPVVDPEGIQSSKVEEQVAVTPKEEPSVPDGYINGYAYVDLGLSSGLKWATCNVGSDKPETSYVYYAWGETSPKSKYDIDCRSYKKSYSSLESAGIIGVDGNLSPSCDAATANMGASWRMPTKNEFQGLKDECKWKYFKLKGSPGILVTGPNGKSIFLPYAGYRWSDSRKEVGDKACYWSSTPTGSFYNVDAYAINGSGLSIESPTRENGLAVRAVSE